MTNVSQAFSMFFDTGQMQALSQQELPDCLSGDWQLTQCQIQHPRYKTYLNPGSRSKSFLAAAYHLQGKGKQNKAQDKILDVKAFLGERSQDEYKKACADFQGKQQNGPLHTLWMEGLPGQPLVKVINADNADKLMLQIAKNLADFHHAELIGLDTISEDDLLSETQKKSVKLQKAFLGFSERINGVLLKLNEQKLQLPLLVNCLVHGDFHIEQLMLWDNDRMALFDFDELAMGNPLMDVANFFAALRVLKLEEHFAERLIKQLFNVYQFSSASVISAAHFEWHLKVQLLTWHTGLVSSKNQILNG
jgi:hypothetical protein